MLNQKLPRKFKNVIITGASQGIGRALAESFARRGANLLLVARNEANLKEVAASVMKKYPGVQALVCVLDLSVPESAKKLKAFCQEKGFAVDALVNNAGYGLWGKFAELSLKEQLDCLQVNATSLVQLTHEFLPLLMESRAKGGAAGVLNVSSMTAYQAIPTFAIYAASKSFVLSFSRALHHELKPAGVVVTALVPGATESGFIDRAGMQHTAEKAKKITMTAASVAEIAVKGLENGQIEVIPGGLNLLMAGVTRLVSKRMLETTAESLYRKQ